MEDRRELRNEMFGEEMSEDEIVAQIREARKQLEYLEEHPNEFLALGIVCGYTSETTKVSDCDCGEEHPTEGFLMRLINPRGHEGYYNIAELLHDLDAYDHNVDELKIREDETDEPDIVGIGALLSGDGSLG